MDLLREPAESFDFFVFEKTLFFQKITRVRIDAGTEGPGGGEQRDRAGAKISPPPRQSAELFDFSRKFGLRKISQICQKLFFFAKQTRRSGGGEPSDRSCAKKSTPPRESADSFDFFGKNSPTLELFAIFSKISLFRQTNRAVGWGRSVRSHPGRFPGPVSRTGRVIRLLKKFEI